MDKAEDKKYNDIVVVDDNDSVIGAMDLMEAYVSGVTRRASRVYVFNESGEILLQRRGKNVLNPLLLDQSAAGHVDKGESYEETAKRELMEELGLEGELKPVLKSFKTPFYFNAAYKLVVPDDIKINFNKEEIEEVIWLSVDELEQRMTDSQEEFNDQFIAAWSILRDKLIGA